MKVAIGSDHGGFALKCRLAEWLAREGHEVADLGCHNEDSVDYPAFAESVCIGVQQETYERGILVCGTGIGMSIAANRYAGIRAALCHEGFTARMSREHNDANVLCLGGRVIGEEVAFDILRHFMTTEFAGGRHLRRIKLLQ